MSDRELPDDVVHARDLLHAHFAALPTAGALGTNEAEVLYGMAYGLLEQGRYWDARQFFQILATYCPQERKFWHGLGYSLKMQEEYDDAIYVYSMMGVLHPGAADAAFFIAECQVLKGDREAAQKSLELAIGLCEIEEGFDEVKARAKAMSAFLAT